MGLLGTRPVMISADLRRRFADEFGIEVMAPEEDEQIEIDRIIFDELVRRELKPESKEYYLGAIDRLRARGAEGVILGCTEIFLLVSQPDRPDSPMFDTTALHVEEALRMSVAG